MEDNIFFRQEKQMSLEDYMDYAPDGRGNLGKEIPVTVYRLMEYSLKEQLTEQFGEETQKQIFRDAGYRAGIYFSTHILDMTLELNPFIASLQKALEQMRIGVLRIESFDRKSGVMMLTVSEDADCSGLPPLGVTVCNYDEGFIAGILSSYLKKPYQAEEIDCWATGDRVCRFRAEPK